MLDLQMPYEEAENFFSDFYGGKHHFPGKIKEWGFGWCMIHYGELASFDFNGLTRLCFMAHDRCIRVAVSPAMKYLRIEIHKRARGETSNMLRHPDLDEAVAYWKKINMAKGDTVGQC
jgi:hypothetical protein